MNHRNDLMNRTFSVLGIWIMFILFAIVASFACGCSYKRDADGTWRHARQHEEGSMTLWYPLRDTIGKATHPPFDLGEE